MPRSEQLTFYDPPFQRHSMTSREAARRIDDKVMLYRERVLQVIRRNGPITDEAGAQFLDMAQNTYRPRRVELERAGLIEKDAILGRTLSGRRAVRWRVK